MDVEHRSPIESQEEPNTQYNDRYITYIDYYGVARVPSTHQLCFDLSGCTLVDMCSVGEC